MSSPPVSKTPSQRATDSATSAGAGSAGAIHGSPPAAATARQYWLERLTELSSNSTPRFCVLGEIKIKGGFMMSHRGDAETQRGKVICGAETTKASTHPRRLCISAVNSKFIQG